MKVPSYNKANRKTYKEYKPLPKGNYVCKLLKVEEFFSRNGARMLKFAFDIAEGEYKDFYMKQFNEDTRENKKWSADAVYYLTVPTENCEAYVQDGWDTFFGNIEDSNNGFIWDGSSASIPGKTFGGIFRIEQTEYNGRIYDHTRLYRTCIAQEIRDGKATWTPKDKLLEIKSPDGSDGFIGVPEDAPLDLPF